MDRGPLSASSSTSTSRLGAFKLFGKVPKRERERDRPPIPPAKDHPNFIPYARYNASSPSLLNNLQSSQSPSGSSSKETFLSPSPSNSSRSNVKSPASTNFLSKFTSLGRRPRFGSIVRSISVATSGGSSNETNENTTPGDDFELVDEPSIDDGSISTPWNFQVRLLIVYHNSFKFISYTAQCSCQ